MSNTNEAPIYVHTLRVPIVDQTNTTLTELSFRKPLAGDMLRCGIPVKYQPHDEDQEIAFNEGPLVKMLAAMSGVFPPFIERMDSNDLMECAWGIAPFFIPGMRKASATPSAPPSA